MACARDNRPRDCCAALLSNRRSAQTVNFIQPGLTCKTAHPFKGKNKIDQRAFASADRL